MGALSIYVSKESLTVVDVRTHLEFDQVTEYEIEKATTKAALM